MTHSTAKEIGIILCQPAIAFGQSIKSHKKTTLFVLAVIAYLVAYSLSTEFREGIGKACTELAEHQELVLGIGGVSAVALWFLGGWLLDTYSLERCHEKYAKLFFKLTDTSIDPKPIDRHKEIAESPEAKAMSSHFGAIDLELMRIDNLVFSFRNFFNEGNKFLYDNDAVAEKEITPSVPNYPPMISSRVRRITCAPMKELKKHFAITFFVLTVLACILAYELSSVFHHEINKIPLEIQEWFKGEEVRQGLVIGGGILILLGGWSVYGAKLRDSQIEKLDWLAAQSPDKNDPKMIAKTKKLLARSWQLYQEALRKHAALSTKQELVNTELFIPVEDRDSPDTDEE